MRRNFTSRPKSTTNKKRAKSKEVSFPSSPKIDDDNFEQKITFNCKEMNYIFSTISIESTKKDIRALEKLEKDYLKRIENIKNGKIDIPKIRAKSAIKSKKRYKLLYSKRNEKKII